MRKIHLCIFPHIQLLRCLQVLIRSQLIMSAPSWHLECASRVVFALDSSTLSIAYMFCIYRHFLRWISSCCEQIDRKIWWLLSADKYMPWASSIWNSYTVVIVSLQIQRDKLRSKSMLWLSSGSKTKMAHQACILQRQGLWSDYQLLLNKCISWEINQSHAVGIREDRRQNLFPLLAEVWDIVSVGCLQFK